MVFTTDKSSKLTADSTTNYRNALDDHIKDDILIDKKKVKQIENQMNQHLGHFNKMFKVGSNWGHQDRVANASTSTNIPPPPKYGLRKDHKAGHPLRPVCGAREAPNSRFGHFLSKIVGHYADCAEATHASNSSEEMRAAFEELMS